jgi:hypothetical protein
MSLTMQDRADIARLVKNSFESRTPAFKAFLDRVARVEAEHPGICKFGVPAEHPLGPVDERYAVEQNRHERNSVIDLLRLLN